MRLRSCGEVVEFSCDAYAVFDEEAALLLVSDHTLLESEDIDRFEIVWIV